MKRRAFAAFALAIVGAAACKKGGDLVPVGHAPPAELAAVDQDGKTRSIADAKGHPLVVYFYPKDGTPGCTKQACAFRDTWSKFEEAGVVVFGVSGDDAASKKEFAAEHSLPFPVLADPDLRWASAFGVGSRMGMTDRVTFLLDREGRVAKVYPDVDPAVNVRDVLEDAAHIP